VGDNLKKIKWVGLISNLLDGIFLIPGMAFIVIGVYKIYAPAGYISVGFCLIALAFIIAKKQSVRR
jgi:hypothetical protein